MLRPLIGAVLIAALIVAFAIRAVDELDLESGPSALRFEPPTRVAAIPGGIGVASRWNSVVFINDNLWTAGAAQYAVWVDPAGRPIAGRRDGLQSWQTVDLSRVTGNPLASPTAPDPHNVYAIGMDERGFVHIVGNSHNEALRYVRSRQPHAIGGWDRRSMVGKNEASVSYPVFVRAPDGALLFLHRDGYSGHGDMILNRFDVSRGTWQRVGTLIGGRASGESAYLQRVAVDEERDVIHLMFVWRRDSDVASNRDISYLRSADGGRTWQTSSGRTITLPVTRATAEVVLANGPRSPLRGPLGPGAYPVNQGGLAVDSRGRPHAVFRVRDADGGSQVVHVWHDGTSWRSQPVTGVDVDGRPTLVGTGRGPLQLLWLDGDGQSFGNVWLGRLVAGEVSDARSLLRIPVAVWEPTYDSVAAADGRRLSLLLPLRLGSDDDERARAAVLSWPLVRPTRR